MGISYFIEDIGVSASHVCDNDIRLTNLIEDAIKDSANEDLLINALSICSHIVRGTLNSELVNVVELGVERHENKNEWLRLSQHDAFLSRRLIPVPMWVCQAALTMTLAPAGVPSMVAL